MESTADRELVSTRVFEALPGGKTRLVWKAVFESVAVFKGLKDIATRGNVENLERLEAVLADLRGAA